MNVFFTFLTLLLVICILSSVFRENFHPSFCDDLMLDCNHNNSYHEDCEYLEGCINNKGLKYNPNATCIKFYNNNCRGSISKDHEIDFSSEYDSLPFYPSRNYSPILLIMLSLLIIILSILILLYFRPLSI